MTDIQWSHDASEHNPPQDHRWHRQWNFVIADFQTPSDRFSCLVTNKLTIQLMPERDTVLKMMTAPERLEEVTASLTSVTAERVGLEHTETL